ncbi:uncharacterized protein BcabD6B2_33080 [Babesia caballi]|uniref:Uncharacterized protein n=1 Tax=Babesia caballi TaxID=5871 RepID=A0AAV4LVT2_BABCB|nr:hypothetical protein BcabD6B2_33080 [Babesia caballi]
MSHPEPVLQQTVDRSVVRLALAVQHLEPTQRYRLQLLRQRELAEVYHVQHRHANAVVQRDLDDHRVDRTPVEPRAHVQASHHNVHQQQTQVPRNRQQQVRRSRRTLAAQRALLEVVRITHLALRAQVRRHRLRAALLTQTRTLYRTLDEPPVVGLPQLSLDLVQVVPLHRNRLHVVVVTRDPVRTPLARTPRHQPAVATRALHARRANAARQVVVPTLAEALTRVVRSRLARSVLRAQPVATRVHHGALVRPGRARHANLLRLLVLLLRQRVTLRTLAAVHAVGSVDARRYLSVRGALNGRTRLVHVAPSRAVATQDGATRAVLVRVTARLACAVEVVTGGADALVAGSSADDAGGEGVLVALGAGVVGDVALVGVLGALDADAWAAAPHVVTGIAEALVRTRGSHLLRGGVGVFTLHGQHVLAVGETPAKTVLARRTDGASLAGLVEIHALLAHALGNRSGAGLDGVGPVRTLRGPDVADDVFVGVPGDGITLDNARPGPRHVALVAEAVVHVHVPLVWSKRGGVLVALHALAAVYHHAGVHRVRPDANVVRGTNLAGVGRVVGLEVAGRAAVALVDGGVAAGGAVGPAGTGKAGLGAGLVLVHVVPARNADDVGSNGLAVIALLAGLAAEAVGLGVAAEVVAGVAATEHVELGQAAGNAGIGVLAAGARAAAEPEGGLVGGTGARQAAHAAVAGGNRVAGDAGAGVRGRRAQAGGGHVRRAGPALQNQRGVRDDVLDGVVGAGRTEDAPGPVEVHAVVADDVEGHRNARGDPQQALDNVEAGPEGNRVQHVQVAAGVDADALLGRGELQLVGELEAVADLLKEPVGDKVEDGRNDVKLPSDKGRRDLVPRALERNQLVEWRPREAPPSGLGVADASEEGVELERRVDEVGRVGLAEQHDAAIGRGVEGGEDPAHQVAVADVGEGREERECVLRRVGLEQRPVLAARTKHEDAHVLLSPPVGGGVERAFLQAALDEVDAVAAGLHHHEVALGAHLHDVHPRNRAVAARRRLAELGEGDRDELPLGRDDVGEQLVAQVPEAQGHGAVKVDDHQGVEAGVLLGHGPERDSVGLGVDAEVQHEVRRLAEDVVVVRGVVHLRRRGAARAPERQHRNEVEHGLGVPTDAVVVGVVGRAAEVEGGAGYQVLVVVEVVLHAGHADPERLRLPAVLDADGVRMEDARVVEGEAEVPSHPAAHHAALDAEQAGASEGVSDVALLVVLEHPHGGPAAGEARHGAGLPVDGVEVDEGVARLGDGRDVDQQRDVAGHGEREFLADLGMGGGFRWRGVGHHHVAEGRGVILVGEAGPHVVFDGVVAHARADGVGAFGSLGGEGTDVEVAVLPAGDFVQDAHAAVLERHRVERAVADRARGAALVFYGAEVGAEGRGEGEAVHRDVNLLFGRNVEARLNHGVAKQAVRVVLAEPSRGWAAGRVKHIEVVPLLQDVPRAAVPQGVIDVELVPLVDYA